MTAERQAKLLARISGGPVYDLGVEYFIGMPGWFPAGDPRYTMWMTHTPGGAAVDDPLGVGREQNEHVSYSGSAVSMYAHTGTHIDALNHFGLNGHIYNGFSAAAHLGDRGWTRTGAETIPPIVARGVLIDVAAAKGVERLEYGYRIGREDLRAALERQGTRLQEGDVVLIRTGQMTLYQDTDAYVGNAAGLGMDGAHFLVERGAMVVGADNLSLEAFPSEVDGNYIPVHTFLLAQRGVPILELVHLEELSRDGVYEFAFIAGSLKFRGADAAPLRPLAIPLR
jgi:kynurenine formamidase